MSTLTCKVYELTAEDSQNEGQQHSWEIYELPTGEALDPGETNADQWYDDVDSVEAYGLDFVVEVKDTGHTVEFSEDEIRTSVRSSARSYSDEAIPETLKRYLESGDDE